MFILKKIWFYIAAALSILAGLLAIIFSAKKQGESKAKVDAEKQRTKDNEAIAVRQVQEAREQTKQQAEVLENAIETQNKINSLNSGDANQRLRDKWTRD